VTAQSSLAGLLAQHAFLTADATLRRKRRLRIVSAIGCASALACVLGVASIHAGPMQDVAALLAVVSFTILIVAAYRADRYRDVAAARLDRVAPMLQDDAELRAAVKAWMAQRPLQVRDYHAVVSLIPAWKESRKLAAFTRSIAEPASLGDPRADR
jgi:hypothetical protein